MNCFSHLVILKLTPHHKWFQPEAGETTERREQEAKDDTAVDFPHHRKSLRDKHLTESMQVGERE